MRGILIRVPVLRQKKKVHSIGPLRKVQPSFIREINDVHTVDVSKHHCPITNCRIAYVRCPRSKDKQSRGKKLSRLELRI
jgi:hypothetical protein